MEIVKEKQEKQLILLKSIPGMGNQTATLLLMLNNIIASFDKARQLWFNVEITSATRKFGTIAK
jgi:hypothetical protein